jgi:hypothetical protein
MTPYAKEGAMLSERHLDLIIISNISSEVCSARGYRTIEVKARLETFGFTSSQRSVPGLLIPLYNSRGEYISCQYRPDAPRLGKKDGKPIKYESPARSRVVIDVHPFLSRPRTIEPTTPFDSTELPPLILDPNVPLIVTEGTRKEDSAVSLGLCAVAILGVASWRRCLDWNEIPIKGRMIYLCFDSDVVQKRAVLRELRELAEWLQSHGAQVQILQLPPGPHGEKVGMDDWIFAHLHNGLSADQVCLQLIALTSDDLPFPQTDDRGGKDEAGPYFIRGGGFWYRRRSADSEVEVRLTNFTARICADLGKRDQLVCMNAIVVVTR